MAVDESQPGWPATAVSLGETLCRLTRRIAAIEEDLRFAQTEYERLVEATRRSALGPDAATERLTGQQLRVANLLAMGMSNAQIAAALCLSINTVKVHVRAVLQKRSLQSRWQLVQH